MPVSKLKPKTAKTTRGHSTRANPGKRKASSKPKSVKASVAASRNRSAPSKQDVVLALLQRPKGVTISEINEATGWQPHSIRGFLSGVVKKKLKLKIESSKDGGDRSYRIKTQASS
jgi:transglutaminase/protease-like cytokinesis protein 3